MLIGVDIDGVLADLMGGVQRWTEVESPQRSFAYSDVCDWGFPTRHFGDDWHTILDTIWAHWVEYIAPVEIDLPAYQSLRRLHRAGRPHKIAVITNEPPKRHQAMLGFLDWQKIPYDVLIMDGIPQHTKLEYPLDVLVDDNPVLAEQAPLYPRKLVLLRDQPWNRGVAETENLRRVGSLKAAVDTILSLGRGG